MAFTPLAFESGAFLGKVAAVPSDNGSARLALLIVGLFYVGARRLEHVRYLGGDPLVARFCDREGWRHSRKGRDSVRVGQIDG